MKTSKNVGFSDIFRAYRKGTLKSEGRGNSLRTRFFGLPNFCDDEIVKNNKNDHLWSSNSQKDVIFSQEV